MASILNEILVNVPADEVWAAVRDFGALDKRLVPGFVVECRLDGDARLVKFSNGTEARELLVDLNDSTRRLVYAVVGGRTTHYSASVQVHAEGNSRSRLVWIIDLLPNEFAGYVEKQASLAVAIMKPTLEGQQPN